MTGVSAGRNIVIAGHGAQVIEGAYVDHRTINIVVPANADPLWLKQVSESFGLVPRQPGPDMQSYARLEAQLDRAAHLLAGLEGRVVREHVQVPHDLAGLRRLRKEIDARMAAITAESLRDFSWLSNAPAFRTRLTGYRLQREIYGPNLASRPQFPTRFSDGSFDAYYAARDVAAALYETTHFRISPTRSLNPYVFFKVEADVERLLDLSDPGTRDFIEACSPGFYGVVVAQGDFAWSRQLGAWLARAGFGGCIFPSAISVGRENIVLFPQNLTSDAIKVRQVESYHSA